YAEEALSLGERVKEPRAALSYAAQLTMIRFVQGRLAELEPSLRAVVEQYPALVVARCGLALALVEAGHEDAARLEFESLARDGFSCITRDWNWLASMAVAVEVCIYLCDRERAKQVYEILLPYSGRNVTLGWYEVCYGSMSRYLAKLDRLMGRFD